MDEPEEFRHAAVPARARIRRDRDRVPPRLETVLVYLEEHLFDRGLSVTRLKEECGVRDNSLLIRFTSVLGRTPYGYIEDRRLETACRLLTESTLKIWRIAQLLGYTSLQVFSRAFARWSGERPSAYRQRPPGARSVPPGPVATVRRRRPSLSGSRIAAIQAEEIWAELQRRTPRGQRQLLGRLRLASPALVRLLCRESRGIAEERPQRAIELAQLALTACESFAGRRELFVRLRVESWAELANAYRAAGQLQRSRQALAAGEARLAEQPAPPALRAAVLAVKAALYRYAERFQDALGVADEALALARRGDARRGDDKALLAEVLMQKASLLSRSGDPAGVALLEEALGLMRE